MDPEQREEEIKKMKNAEWLKSDEDFFGKNPIRGGLCGAQYDDRVVNLMWDDPPVGSVTWKAKQRLKDPECACDGIKRLRRGRICEQEEWPSRRRRRRRQKLRRKSVRGNSRRPMHLRLRRLNE